LAGFGGFARKGVVMVVRGVSVLWTGCGDSVEDFNVCRAAGAEWAGCFC